MPRAADRRQAQAPDPARARAAVKAAAAGAKPRAGSRPISPLLFYAVTVASIGGPLALLALEIPAVLSGAGSSAGLATLMGTLAFLFPLSIWYRYSERIASSGGLYAFVEAAVGRPLALIQAGFWIVSYFLYLVYTVPYIVYDLLPAVFPQVTPLKLPLDLALTLVIALVMLSPLIVGLGVLAAIAVSQVIVALLLVGVTLLSLGAPITSFTGHGNLPSILLAVGKTSSLYICGSLPLFLAGEVQGGSATVRRALTWAFPAVGALAIIGVFPLARASQSIIDATIPGLALAQTTGVRALAIAVGLGVAVSVIGLIFAEFLALTRLLQAIVTRLSRWMVAIAVGFFLAASLVSLVDPERAYTLLLKPSLIALWISQLIVVSVYPWFVRKRRVVQAGDVGLAGGASLLMLFALYTAITS